MEKSFRSAAVSALALVLSAALPFSAFAQGVLSPDGAPQIRPSFAIPAAAASRGAARVEALSGRIFIYRKGAALAEPLTSASLPPQAGDRVVTGTDGSGAFVLADGSEVRLEPDSELYIPEEAPRQVTLFLKLGKIWVKASRDYRRVFEVRTPQAVASVRGTEFSVAAGAGASVVQVYQGAVGVAVLLRGRPFGAESLVLPGHSVRALGGLLSPIRAVFGGAGKASLSRPVKAQIKARLKAMLKEARARGRASLAVAVQDALATKNPQTMLEAAEALSEEAGRSGAALGGPASAAFGDARLQKGFEEGKALEDLSRPAPPFAPREPGAFPVKPPKNRQADAIMNKWFAGRELSLQMQQAQQSAMLAHAAASPGASPTAAMVTAAAYQQQFQQQYLHARQVMAQNAALAARASAAPGAPPRTGPALAAGANPGQAPSGMAPPPVQPPVLPPSSAAAMAAMPPPTMQPPTQSAPTAQYSYTAPTIAQPSYSAINYVPPPSTSGSTTCTTYTCTPGTCSATTGICTAPTCTCN